MSVKHTLYIESRTAQYSLESGLGDVQTEVQTEVQTLC